MTTAPGAPADRGRRRERAWMAASGVIAVAAAALAVAHLRRPATVAPTLRLALTRPASAPYEHFDSAVLSPDGRGVAFVAHAPDGATTLWVRALDTEPARPLPGTAGAILPFWSPDSRSVGFFADGKLKRIEASGGPPQVLADAPNPRGGAWGGEGVIVFAKDEGPLHRVSADGGTAIPVTQLRPREEAHRWPSFLPDGRHFVFLGDAPKTEDHFLRVGSVDGGEAPDLVPAVTNAVYAAPGHLLFVRGRTLMAQPFDPERRRLSGTPAPVADSLVQNTENHRFEFSAAANGLLTFRTANPDRQLTWLDRSGRRLGVVGEPGNTGSVELSPDGRRVAFSTRDQDGRNADIWFLELARGQTSRVTSDPASDGDPVWSPDGRRIAFLSMRTAMGDLYQTSVGGGDDAMLHHADAMSVPASWSPDGRHLLFDAYMTANIDIWVLPLAPGRKAEPFLKTPFYEYSPRFSPDGRRVAYVSEESGRPEVYVRDFPDSGEKWQVSSGGGRAPRWRRDGKEIFFVTPGSRLMAAAVRPGPAFDVAPAVELFRTEFDGYDVAADGERFLVGLAAEDLTTTPLTVVTGWTSALPR